MRLLASIISDLWKRQQSLVGGNLLIHSGQVNFANLDALSGQLKKLNGNGWDAVITADVAGSSSNAFKIDGNKKEYGEWYLTQSITSVILMTSFGSDGANKGISVPEIKLHLLTPNGFNHNSVNGALDELESSAYYLYYAQTGGAGKRYWFNTKPNINILINQAKGDIKTEDVEAEILKRLKDKTSRVQLFNVLVDPPEDIPEQMKPTLVLLHPKYTASPEHVNGKTKPVIERIATKKGNSERIYRNTILFLVCSEMGLSKLQSGMRDFLACQKISTEYNSQLGKEEREDIKKRIEDASKQSDNSLVTAYSMVMKYFGKTGTKEARIEKLNITQFKDAIDNQINTTIIDALKADEWLLESVGLSTLKINNLFPTLEHSIKAKDVYEAFLRFDDKPMVTGQEAVSKSILKYCYNGEYCIATGDGTTFTKFFLQENVPFFDVTDSTYYLLDKSLKPKPNEPATIIVDERGKIIPPLSLVKDEEITPLTGESKKYKSITVSGKVPLERYTELFNYFITPFAMSGNKIEIEVKFKIKAVDGSPIDESKQQYKSAKEASKQLGLNFEEES